MPRVKQTYVFEITPEKFMQACSDEELYKIYLLIATPVYYKRLQRIIARSKNGHTLNR